MGCRSRPSVRSLPGLLVSLSAAGSRCLRCRPAFGAHRRRPLEKHNRPRSWNERPHLVHRQRPSKLSLQAAS
jgi:hypothetical protein